MGKQARLKKERRLERQERQRAKLARIAEGEARGCLVCRRSDGGFSSEEHPLSESIGSTEVVLPNGVTCDVCNNGVLAVLDRELADFFPIKLRRTMLDVKSKSGKVPVTRFARGTLRSTGPGSLVMNLLSPKDQSSFRQRSLGGNAVALNFNMSGGKRVTPRYASLLSRALLKTALECAWLDLGEEVLDTRFDHVRDVVLGKPRDGYLLVGRKPYPNDEGLRLDYFVEKDASGADFVGVVACLYGIVLVTNSRLPAPVLDVPDDFALLVTFSVEDLQAAA